MSIACIKPRKIAKSSSVLDRCLADLQDVLEVCMGVHRPSTRPNPAAGLAEPALPEKDRKLSAALMRVNHSGEVCAQALYRGQAVGAKHPRVVAHMEAAAAEEGDHLNWCQDRLAALGSHTSYLNPFWYLGSFALGYVAARCGDAWSLGFVMETERQVEGHLQQHLERLPSQDAPSRVVVQAMIQDEAEHAAQAELGGGRSLPDPIPRCMAITSKLMTTLSHFV